MTTCPDCGLSKSTRSEHCRRCSFKYTQHYPWEQLTNGNIWQLRQGEDYHITTRHMQTIISQYALRHGLQYHTKKTPDGLLVVFKPKQN